MRQLGGNLKKLFANDQARVLGDGLIAAMPRTHRGKRRSSVRAAANFASERPENLWCLHGKESEMRLGLSGV